ncbi:SapC family protein [Echinimonas agarilytica]|uniref:SapC family protein n=1 Tax=Echinimonas agarilytica TaxID=1215918 RepID=A0AA42B6Q0_9GAMM|nr:SapC family protein [Echinimonas agarilytica]MCM2679042.1 SapC family protein [Echinimonas agarilytica]
MSVKIAPITAKDHSDIKIKPLGDFSGFAERHLSPITIHEFSRAASCFPIVFIKDSESDQYKVVAMFSVNPKQNVFVKDGKWTATYLPVNLARGPYFISNDEKPVICIDENDARVSKEEGAPLFNENGERSEYFDGIIESMQNLINQDGVTQQFIDKLVELELLHASNLTITRKDGTKHEVSGIHMVDEPKFKELTDEQVLDLNKSGFLGLIYIHLCSLGQIQNLLRD